MSEGNCSCCCAYLNPPWWVTMGYAPLTGFQDQRPPAAPGAPISPQPPTQGAGSGAKPPTVAGEVKDAVGKVAGDISTGRLDQVPGDIAAAIGDLLHFL
jgi:hypothetical protein